MSKNERIEQLERKVADLEAKIQALSLRIPVSHGIAHPFSSESFTMKCGGGLPYG